MTRFRGFAFGIVCVASLIWSGCSTEEQTPVSPVSVSKPAAPPGLEVRPQYRVATGRNGERLTVFVFYAKGGNGGGGKPPSGGGGGETCTDLNTNQAYDLLGVTWPIGPVPVRYNATFEPGGVAGLAQGAVTRAFDEWQTVVPVVVALTADANAPLVPARDEANVVGWRQLVGKDSKRILASTYIWDDGAGAILEADILYNTSQSWAVNTSIYPGGTDCGSQFDVEAIGVHEIGHFYGLGHVFDDGIAANGNEGDATMAPTAAKGELMKQTLTTGDRNGFLLVTP